MNRLLPLMLAGCAGSVGQGIPLEQATQEPSTASDAGVPCALPAEQTWHLLLTDDGEGTCEHVVTLDMIAADETHCRVVGAVGYCDYQLSFGECVITLDVTTADGMRVIGYVEQVSGWWVGGVSGSRSVYEHAVLDGCIGLYEVREVSDE